MTESSDGEDVSFGQRVPPLHVYVKKTLKKYPEGGQILKELLQNADDAGARKVIFLYDKTDHPTEHLWSQSLNKLYGPALCVYNDATFTPEDWKSIQNPEQSEKQDDPTKVGRFGLGFLSVYHLTDVPSIFSGNYVGFLDPNEKYFATDPYTNVKEKGKNGHGWRLSTKLLQPPLKDQFTPFMEPLFNCTPDTFKKGQFHGTVFRFPLRKEGADSLISSSTYNDERVQNIIKSFKNDAEISLLFLKNVECVSIYEKSPKESETQLVYSVEMSSDDKVSLRNERSKFLDKCRQNTSAVSRIHAKVSTRVSSKQACCVNHYTVINSVKRHGLSSSMQSMIENNDLKQLPWVGVAAKRGSIVQSEGRMFCFLPLPESESSPVPVHIHGYFGLGDNRRSIKWPDKESQQDISAQWNVCLVEEVFPEAYVDLITTSISCGLSPSIVYELWPRIHHLQDTRKENVTTKNTRMNDGQQDEDKKDAKQNAWENGIKQAIAILETKHVLYTKLKGGQWKKPDEVFIDTQNNSLVHKVLLKKGYPVVQIPSHILEALRMGEVQFNEVTPDLVRKALKRDRLGWLDRQEKMQLLDYILEDNQPDSLENIHLLPLSNGDFVQFSRFAETIYIPNSNVPKAIFPNMESFLLSDDCTESLKTHDAQSATQLQMLSINAARSLINDCLQKAWPERSQTVKWKPGAVGQPERGWLRELWKWLQKEEISLSKFVSLPLIPIAVKDGVITLSRLETNRMIYKTHKSVGEELSESVCSLLESIAAIVVKKSLPDFIEMHTEIDEFIACGTPEGVMKILEANWSTSIPQYVSQNSSLKKDLLNLISQIRRLPWHWKEIVKKLPLFQTNTGEFVSVQQCPLGVKDGFHGIPVKKVNHRFILINDSSRLAEELGVQEVTLESLLEHYILPNIGKRYYSANERDNLMKWILEYGNFDKFVATTQFIPTSDGRLASPGELFDPENRSIQSLYHSKPVFPTKQYASGRLLGHIRRVGFKTESSISAHEILQIAVEISRDMDWKRSKALLDFLCYHSDKDLLSTHIMHESIYQELGCALNNVAWVSCEKSPPYWYNNYLPWCQRSKSLQCPGEVQLETFANLVGSVMPLVKVNKLHKQFCTFFAWTKDKIKSELVIRHLRNVAAAYKQDRTGGHNIPIEDIYGFLNRIPLPQLIPLFSRQRMDSVPWVWHGNGFATPHMVAFSSGISEGYLPSYLHLVPSNLHKFKQFLIQLGVKESFTVDDYLSILHSVKASSNGEPLSSTQMDIVQDVLKSVTSLFDDLKELNGRLLIPDSKCVLRPCDEVTYNDRNWDQASEEEFIYAHNSLTSYQAQMLGIRSQRDVQLDQCSSDLGFELPFGQTEKLTTRLRGILREYSHTPDVLKELLQNADDAGASELHIVFDRRNHMGSKISGPEWKPMHESPALCVYNDKPFTDEDIDGIQNVGVGGKISDATTTGRFGIGFNAVYHLTDCPTFLTQDSTKLCIFDPHVKYVPRATPSKPGKLYKKDGNYDYQANFPDITEGYLSEYKEFDLQKGTMFRFPLRQCGVKSEISDENYTTERVYSLLKEFEKVSADALLFLNNVQKISISETDQKSGKLKLRYCVNSSVSKEGQVQRRKVTDRLKEFKTHQAHDTSQINCVYSMKVKDSHEREVDWLVCQTLGYSDPTKQSLLTGEFFNKAFIPRGGVAAKMNTVHPVRSVSNDSTQGKAFCFLPLQIDTSLPVHVNGTFKLDQSRSNLKKGNNEIIDPWNKLLAEQVITPAYAHLIEAAGKILFKSKSSVSIRDGLWTCDAFDKLFPTKLQQLSDVWKLIAVSTLEHIANHNMKVLPVIQSERETFNFDEIHWFSPTYSADNASLDSASLDNALLDKAFFDNLYTLDPAEYMKPVQSINKQVQKKSKTFRQFLLRTGFNLIASGPSICRAFQDAKVKAKFISPEICIRHIRSSSRIAENLPCEIGKTAFKSPSCLEIALQYCLDGIDDVKGLQGLPLQLDESSTLTLFSDSNAKYLTYDYNLIPGCPDIFVHRNILNILFGWLNKIKSKDTKEKKKKEDEENEGIFKDFTIKDLAQFIHTQLPAEWKGLQSPVDWKSKSQPKVEWLHLLWEFIGSDDLEPLKDWPIFPTKCGRLFAPNIGKHVLFLDNYGDTITRKHEASALQKLGCSTLDVEKMFRSRQYTYTTAHSGSMSLLPKQDTFTKYLATPINRRDVLNVIRAMNDDNVDINGKLTPSECDTILMYFQSGINEYSKAELNQLKRLPFFPCVNSSRRLSIDQFQYCYTVNACEANIPDFDTLIREAGCVLLTYNMALAMLFQFLKVEFLETIDIYRQHVLPILKTLPQPARLSHVEFIRDNLLPAASEDERDVLHSALKDVAFIPSNGGQYRAASYYFDKANHVFAKLVKCNRFLPEEFCTPKWKPLLKKIGLQCTVTDSHFIDFAEDIESRSTRDDERFEDLEEKSRVLLSEFHSNISLQEEDVLSSITSIRFIPSVRVHRELEEIYPQYTSTPKNQFICFQHGVHEQNKYLIWTVDHILPSYAVPHTKTIRQKLGIQTTPCLENVVMHAQNVCNKMAEHNTLEKEDPVGHLRSRLANVLKQIMSFFNHNIKENEETLQLLQNTPICLVEDGTTLVKANQLVFEMDKTTEDQFRPYLYKVSRDFVQFEELLKILGTEEELTFNQLSSVMNSIKDGCKDMKMSINERMKAHSATRCMYLLLKSTNGKCDITGNSLYLPTSEDNLQLSSQLYYTDLDETDARIQSTDVELLVPLKQILGRESTIKMTEIITLLPEYLRPKKLATEEKPLTSNILCCTKGGSFCPLMDQTLSIVNSSDTREVLLRLLQHQHGGVLSSEQRINIARLQYFDQMKCMKELRTGFFDDKGTFLGERRLPRYAFLEKKESGEHELSFIHTEISDYRHSSLFYVQLAESISGICKLNLEKLQIQYLSQVLPLPSMASKNEFLDSMEVPKFESSGEESVQEHRSGSLVPRDIWCLLDNDIHTEFHPNEIAVYKPDDDDLYIYVEILECLPLENSNDTSTSFFCMYKIDADEESPIVVSVLDLFKFRRPLEDDDCQTSEQNTVPDLDGVKIQIKQDIDEAMRLPQREIIKCVRRLYRMWHPDRNPQRIELATEAFQFLKEEIEIEMNQLTFSSNYSQWDDDSSRAFSEEEIYRQRAQQSNTTNTHQSGFDFVPTSFTSRRPNPRKGKLWFRQAEEDLKTAYEYSRKREEGSKAWTALMIQQAIEKGLKAVIFHIDGSQSLSHNLYMLLSEIEYTPFDKSKDEMRDLVNQLVRLGCDAINTRYPEDGTYRTTGEKYENFDSEEALICCDTVINIVKEMLNTDIVI